MIILTINWVNIYKILSIVLSIECKYVLNKFKKLHCEKLDNFQVYSTCRVFEQGMNSMDVFGLVVILHIICA